MTPTPPSTTSSSAGAQSPEDQYRVVRKRNRIPLSCGPCRHRKLKCNRSHPCENCIRRGDASSCSYAASGTRKKNQSQGATSPDDMQNRIDRLEGLVLSLMTNGAQSDGPAAATAAVNRSQSGSTGTSAFPKDPDPEDDDDMIKEEVEDEDSEVEGVAKSLGVLKVDKDQGKSMYLGESHWHLVLADLAEVKNYFSSHKKEFEKNYERIKESSKPSNALGGPAHLLGFHAEATDLEIRSELPPKSAVDKLVTRYFNSYDPAVHVLHSPTFHKQLHDHWRDQSKTSIVWLGLLYSLLCLAMQSYHKMGDEPLEWKGRSLELASEYRLRAVQCLVNSDYTKPSDYTLETLILYVNGEFMGRWDAEVGIWVMIGIITRLAMRMGYHRDPSKYPGIMPFQAEMRRRIWGLIRIMDTLFSFQLALPAMIRSSDCDAELPRNIFEDEFGPDCKVLPPARPPTEPTPISYMVTKGQVAIEFAAILETVNAVNSKSIGYDEILKRDHRLRELRDNLPPHLRLLPMDQCMHDPATLLMQRFNVDTLWQKTMCVLHRKYIARARHNPRYAHSRRAGLDASLAILRHHVKLHQESQPGGRLRAMKYYISSLTKADYLLGAMIVCLELHLDSISEKSPGKAKECDAYFWTLEQRADMLQALQASQAIWKQSAETSLEAFKASSILGVMLDKLGSEKDKQNAPQTTAEAFAQFDEQNLRPEHSAAMGLGMLSDGLSPNTAAMFNSIGQSLGGSRYGNIDMSMSDSSASTGMMPNYPWDPSNSLGNMPFPVFANAGSGQGMMDVGSNLDWEAWDSYVQNANTNVDPAFQFYPTTIDQSSPVNDDTQQQNTDPALFGAGSVFMGASPNTPGK